MAGHLPPERLGAPDPTPDEAAHLATCDACRAHRAGDTVSLSSPFTWSDPARATVSVESEGGASASVRLPPMRADALSREAEGRYGRVAEIGAGGMGRVDLVEDRHLGRWVALKEHGGRDAGQRFLREARITAQLEHPGVAPVHDLGVRADGRLYCTMRRIRGRTLTEALREATSLPERLRLLGAARDGRATRERAWRPEPEPCST